ncbi:hypothetical protein F5Y05DRAFT_423772 [Hypoxylon sp. FL0543]|nr:hypothetical protein F5Y05DRAFT_423772 [Hypoxylon sp. FL0543]
MAPFQHRHIFYGRSRNPRLPEYGDAEKMVDCNPIVDRINDFYDQRYAQSPTVEPLSESMVCLVRSQLASLFYERMAVGIQCTVRFRSEWTKKSNELSYYIRSFHRPRLPLKMFFPRSHLIRSHLLEYADVHVAIYFDWFGDASCFRTIKCNTEWLGRYVWRKWFDWHGGRPPFLGHQKFVKPIGLKGSEPRDIQNVREFHRSLCDAVSIGLSQQELPKQSPPTPRSGPMRQRLRNPKPTQLPDLRPYTDRGREMAHLFRAIVIIVDDQVMQDAEPEIYRRVIVPRKENAYYEKGRDWVVSQYSVLLFRTGDDAHLSSPISFQSLYESGKALPVNRPDCDDDGISVTRVKIDTAVEFLLDLIQREREAIPSIGLAAEIENRQHLDACEKWVDGVMEDAGRVGIDENGFTWEAVRRAKAALNGEVFDEFQINPTWNDLAVPYKPFGVGGQSSIGRIVLQKFCCFKSYCFGPIALEANNLTLKYTMNRHRYFVTVYAFLNLALSDHGSFDSMPWWQSSFGQRYAKASGSEFAAQPRRL